MWSEKDDTILPWFTHSDGKLQQQPSSGTLTSSLFLVPWYTSVLMLIRSIVFNRILVRVGCCKTVLDVVEAEALPYGMI